jgi:excisionase family DNA binding protein
MELFFASEKSSPLTGLGRTVDALREMIWAGKLRFVRDGKRILLDINDLDLWIEQSKEQYTF